MSSMRTRRASQAQLRRAVDAQVERAFAWYAHLASARSEFKFALNGLWALAIYARCEETTSKSFLQAVDEFPALLASAPIEFIIDDTEENVEQVQNQIASRSYPSRYELMNTENGQDQVRLSAFNLSSSCWSLATLELDVNDLSPSKSLVTVMDPSFIFVSTLERIISGRDNAHRRRERQRMVDPEQLRTLIAMYWLEDGAHLILEPGTFVDVEKIGKIVEPRGAESLQALVEAVVTVLEVHVNEEKVQRISRDCFDRILTKRTLIAFVESARHESISLEHPGSLVQIGVPRRLRSRSPVRLTGQPLHKGATNPRTNPWIVQARNVPDTRKESLSTLSDSGGSASPSVSSKPSITPRFRRAWINRVLSKPPGTTINSGYDTR